MATATKTKRSTPTAAVPPPDSAADMIERRLSQASVEYEARERMMTEIVDAYGEGEFTPTSLELSAGALVVFAEMGCEGIFEICRELEKHRATLKLREQVGDPQILADARADVAVRRQAEREARGELADLEVGADVAGPVLLRQIKNLEARFAGLRDTRIAAEATVDRLESGRKALRERAPKWLRDSVTRLVLMTRQRSQAHHRLVALKSIFHSHYVIISRWQMELDAAAESNFAPQHDKSNSLYIDYARVYCPAALESGAHGFSAINVRQFGEYLSKLESEGLPALRAEREQLVAELQKVIDDVERPLTAWVESGEL